MTLRTVALGALVSTLALAPLGAQGSEEPVLVDAYVWPGGGVDCHTGTFNFEALGYFLEVPRSYSRVTFSYVVREVLPGGAPGPEILNQTESSTVAVPAFRVGPDVRRLPTPIRLDVTALVATSDGYTKRVEGPELTCGGEASLDLGLPDPLHPDTTTARYVSGSAFMTPIGGPVGQSVCQGGHGWAQFEPFVPNPAGIGGVCDLDVPRWPDAHLEVFDAYLGHDVGFWYRGITADRTYCGPFDHAVGSADVAFYPWWAACRRIMVWPDLGATTGTVTVT